MTLREASELFLKGAKEAKLNISRIQKDKAELALAMAYALSSGREDARALDHPYAKRAPYRIYATQVPIINVVDDNFRHNWYIGQNKNGWYLRNKDWRARYLLEGTESMVSRNIPRYIKRRLESINTTHEAYLAIKKAFTK
jgi:hypothetical protein